MPRYFDEYALDEIVTLSMSLKREHGGSWLFYTGEFSPTTGRARTVMIPKSQCDWDPSTGVLSLPRWLAKRRYLL